MFRILAGAHAASGLFNLLPAFPMDGGRVLRGVLWKITGDHHSATRAAGFTGLAFGALLVLGAVAGALFFNLGALVFAVFGFSVMKGARLALRSPGTTLVPRSPKP